MFGSMFCCFVVIVSLLIVNVFSCTESITVDVIDLETDDATITADMSRFVGTYYFYGFDGTTGYPRYVQPSTNAEFSAGVFGTDGNDYLGMTFTATNVDVIDSDGNNDVFFNSITWYSPANRQVTQASSSLFYIDLGFFNYATSSEYDFFYTNYYPVRIGAIQDFCTTHGYTYEVVQPRIDCPSYDRTIYSDCSGDANCANCQDWGCAQCADGYYKMGNLMRCQSCGDNYPNCATCTDWSGCTSCNGSYDLLWESTCSDEICQPQ